MVQAACLQIRNNKMDILPIKHKSLPRLRRQRVSFIQGWKLKTFAPILSSSLPTEYQ